MHTQRQLSISNDLEKVVAAPVNLMRSIKLSQQVAGRHIA
jgi:hypothetical protein